jgi:hypothetical protein
VQSYLYVPVALIITREKQISNYFAVAAIWFTKFNVNVNGNDSHSNTGGNKFE